MHEPTNGLQLAVEVRQIELQPRVLKRIEQMLRKLLEDAGIVAGQWRYTAFLDTFRMTSSHSGYRVEANPMGATPQMIQLAFRATLLGRGEAISGALRLSSGRQAGEVLEQLAAPLAALNQSGWRDVLEPEVRDRAFTIGRPDPAVSASPRPKDHGDDDDIIGPTHRKPLVDGRAMLAQLAQRGDEQVRQGLPLPPRSGSVSQPAKLPTSPRAPFGRVGPAASAATPPPRSLVQRRVDPDSLAGTQAPSGPSIGEVASEARQHGNWSARVRPVPVRNGSLPTPSPAVSRGPSAGGTSAPNHPTGKESGMNLSEQEQTTAEKVLVAVVKQTKDGVFHGTALTPVLREEFPNMSLKAVTGKFLFGMQGQHWIRRIEPGVFQVEQAFVDRLGLQGIALDPKPVLKKANPTRKGRKLNGSAESAPDEIPGPKPETFEALLDQRQALEAEVEAAQAKLATFDEELKTKLGPLVAKLYPQLQPGE